MRLIAGLALVVVTALSSPGGAHAAGGTIAIVAAENVYGDIARQIGGDRVSVSSIMSNPDADPHLFETTPAVGRSLATAQIVVFNGVGYDPWMAKLLKAAPHSGRVEIVAADLVHKTSGDNPHLWYDPPTMPAVATALAGALGKADAGHAADYQARLRTFIASLDAIHDKIAAIRKKYAGKPVTATEPVFGYMVDALGLTMRNGSFQLAVMNNTEPSAKDMAAFEDDLKHHKVAVLFYNKQVTGKLTQRLLEIARQARVPVVGVTETEPANTSFQDWMLGQLGDTEKALAAPSP
ncbi:MAG: Zinc ABC transporter, substrate-binding protein ZnuA [Pseudolabrys sp.]|jgi:zinc/manganese transport system substrate-binding protein|nr:Zinc ABC transporter, substrate-binding protein ZnuA [Pseudolabrys sp.]